MAELKCRCFNGFDKNKKLEKEQEDEEILKRIGQGEKVLLPGQGGTELEEPMVTFQNTESEVVMPSGKKTYWGRHRIVFGRDRNAREPTSGYGGIGCTAAGSIDIVVGSGGPQPKHKQAAGPNFFTDAARIYLSQKSDIDRYFHLPTDSDIGILPADTRSAVGIKADAVRIIGREGVRIFTNARTKDSGNPEETNSQGGDIQTTNGIHLIANMDHGNIEPLEIAEKKIFNEYNGFNKIQPMVRGDCLVAFLKELIKDITDLQDSLIDFANYQIEFNTAVALHTHEVATAAPAIAIPDFKSLLPASLKSTYGTVFDTTVKTSINQIGINVINRYNWLEPSSKLSILSPYNKTN